MAQETLADLVQEVKGKLGRAQGLLQVSSTAADEPRASVVAFAGLGDEFAVIWAGDARCYLMRDGTMRALTRDHVEVGLRRRLSRSVGGARQLVPDVVTDTFRSGDRVLLCSAPLAHTLWNWAKAILRWESGEPARRASTTGARRSTRNGICAQRAGS